MYKAPALLACFVNLCGIFLMYFVFEETYAGLKDDKEAKELPPADLIAVTVCVVTRFTQLSVSTNIETLGSAYSMLMFDFTAPDAVRVNATSQAVQGVAAAAILLPFLFLDIGKSVFEVTYAFSNVVLATLFSKIIGPRRQGTMQGVFQMSGSIARMTEPILLNVVYAKWGPRGVWLVEIAQLMVTLVLWIIFLKRLVPLEKRFQTKKEIEEKKVDAVA
ncbi:hypothetical protein TELCIR_13659 [Teladorsagia circumcincta]|uniref:Major facilitator superfamily (MFS) profile domain-containing protein n=1 Tax=Teladorsagia circumcincta TaxID=45464 RepID=A0A2G9U4T6_TELCI|nr:hypothetical protein TELCIR_13659 [Teladorsagia circumcincta]